jgi:hypothetical protein
MSVVALVGVLERVDEVDTAVVRSVAGIPGKPGFGVDRAVGLRRDEVKASDVGVDHEIPVAEPGRA